MNEYNNNIIINCKIKPKHIASPHLQQNKPLVSFYSMASSLEVWICQQTLSPDYAVNSFIHFFSSNLSLPMTNVRPLRICQTGAWSVCDEVSEADANKPRAGGRKGRRCCHLLKSSARVPGGRSFLSISYTCAESQTSPSESTKSSEQPSPKLAY